MTSFAEVRRPGRAGTRALRTVLVCLVAMALSGHPTASASGGFYDDFAGPRGAPPNPEWWSALTGRGWDNGEETYSTDNAVLDGQGNLVLRAVNDAGRIFSGRVQTKNKMSFGFGTTTARVKVPAGQGLWPAFWMVGADEDVTPWPESGEIDIIEVVSDPAVFYATIHGPGAGGVYQVQVSGQTADLAADFHEYWVNHLPDRIVIGIDGATVATFTPESLAAGDRWVFNRPMYAILNLAVGGSWAGPPDSSTPFPAEMLVDWVRWDPA